MAAAKCLSSIGLCAVRVTLLDETGAPAGDYYVSDKLIDLGFTPVVSEGQDREVRSGCDCIVAASKAPDILKRFTFSLNAGLIEPALIAMLLGQQAILDADDPDNVIGVNWLLDQLACGGTQANVAIEGWAKATDVDHPDPDYPWFRFRWPSTQWQLDANTLNADYLNPALTGFSRANTEFGDPFNDMPSDGTLILDVPFFGFWLQHQDPPTAQCGLQTIT